MTEHGHDFGFFNSEVIDKPKNVKTIEGRN